MKIDTNYKICINGMKYKKIGNSMWGYIRKDKFIESPVLICPDSSYKLVYFIFSSVNFNKWFEKEVFSNTYTEDIVEYIVKHKHDEIYYIENVLIQNLITQEYIRIEGLIIQLVK